LHSGPAGAVAKLRWTSPVEAEIRIAGVIGAGDKGAIDAYVLKNDVPLQRALATSADMQFRLTTHVLIGDAIDFAVGPAGPIFADGTPLTARILLLGARIPGTAPARAATSRPASTQAGASSAGHGQEYLSRSPDVGESVFKQNVATSRQIDGAHPGDASPDGRFAGWKRRTTPAAESSGPSSTSRRSVASAQAASKPG
jgi:hypothetical protein